MPTRRVGPRCPTASSTPSPSTTGGASRTWTARSPPARSSRSRWPPPPRGGSSPRSAGRGDEMGVTRLDHDANVRPWVLAARDAGARVTWVDVRTADATLDLDSFEAALEGSPRLVAFTLASNAVGTVTPAADLVARA